MTTKRIKIDDLRTDGGTQVRAAIDRERVQTYAEKYAAGTKLPAPVVFYDGTDYWLADGFHRVDAHRANNEEAIGVDIRPGTRRDAILFAVGANEEHGLPRTNADKRRAVETLLRDPEWSKWSDRKIAEVCKVGNQLVGHVRKSLCDSHSEEPRRYVTKHGTEAVMNTKAIGVRSVPDSARPGPSQVPATNLFASPEESDDREDPSLAVPVDDDDLEVIAPEPERVVEREPDPDNRWGASELTASVARICAVSRDFVDGLAREWAIVDSRFEPELRRRVEDALLRATDAAIDRLPPNGTKATQNRARLVLVNGGK
jgi:hypothetical protein